MLRRFGYLVVGIEILAVAVLLGLAWVEPIMSVRTWVFFYDDVSIFEVTERLYEDGFLVLAGLVFGFAIVFPGIKLLALAKGWFHLWFGGGGERLDQSLKIFDFLGKWSMLDVFIVAVVIVAMQSSLVSRVELHPGIYYFAASVLISMVAIYDIRSYRSGRSGRSRVTGETEAV